MRHYFGFFAALVLLLQHATCTIGQERTPVVEFAGLMGNVDVNHRDGRWVLHDQTKFTTAFLPEGTEVKAVLYKDIKVYFFLY